MAIAQTKSLEKELKWKDKQHQLDIKAIGREHRQAMAAKVREHKVEKSNMETNINTLTKDLKVSSCGLCTNVSYQTNTIIISLFCCCVYHRIRTTLQSITGRRPLLRKRSADVCKERRRTQRLMS